MMAWTPLTNCTLSLTRSPDAVGDATCRALFLVIYEFVLRSETERLMMIQYSLLSNHCKPEMRDTKNCVDNAKYFFLRITFIFQSQTSAVRASIYALSSFRKLEMSNRSRHVLHIFEEVCGLARSRSSLTRSPRIRTSINEESRTYTRFRA